MPLIHDRGHDELHLRCHQLHIRGCRHWCQVLLPSPSRAWLTRFWKISLDADRPNGSLFHRYLPKGVAKVVKRLDSSSSTQCQYPAVRSTVKKIFARASSGIKSSRIGSWCVSLFKAWFKGRGSIHTLRAPDFFVAITTLLTHAVGSSTFASTPRFYKLIYRIKISRMSANKIFMFLINPPSGNATRQNIYSNALKKEKRKTAKSKYSTY